MSKQLYINTKRVLLSDDTYFPFTHTISDLENVNIIGIPSSKTVSIPRCVENDEIFGHIADITRVNYTYSDDYYIGVSFNQTKKCNYVLWNDSEIVSEGMLSLDNITETAYEVTLYDQLIEKLELLDGDPDTGEYYLSSCDLISGSNNATMSMESNSTNIYNCNSTSSYIKPVVCIKDGEFDATTIRALTLPSNTYQNVTLPTECTSLQLRTLKNYEVNYATSIKNVIDSINLKYPNTVTTSSLLDTLFNEVQVLCKSPENEIGTVKNTYQLAGDLNEMDDPDVKEYIVLESGSLSDIYLQNGSTRIELNYSASYTGDNALYDSTVIGTLRNTDLTVEATYNLSDPDGTLFCKKWIPIYIVQGTNRWGPIYSEIDFIKGVNTSFTLKSGTYVDAIHINTKVVIDMEMFTGFSSTGASNITIIQMVTPLQIDPAYDDAVWSLFDPAHDSEVQTNPILILDGSNIIERYTTFRTNDVVKGENILPKISIKSFILQIAKFFNLDIVNNNGVLKLQPKAYYLAPENLLMDSISSMDTKNITFSKMVLTTGLPKSDILDKYKKQNKKTYGEQAITTGYTIKNITKPITFETAVPVLLNDYNSFAYDRFCKYSNGGYAKNNHGLVQDIDGDNLCLGYINVVPERIFISDDTQFEAGINQGFTTSSLETKFVHYNPKLVVNTSLADTNIDKYYFTSSVDPSYGVRTMDSYMTFSPYKFTGTTVSASLDMNKPIVNYANITDAQYPSTTTLYHRFHRNMIVDSYSSNTHLLTARIYIDGKLDIYKIYNYKNTSYIISEIVEYDPTSPGIYEVKLMRVNSTSNYTTNILI